VAQLSARRVALTALRAWRTQKRFTDSIAAGLLDKTTLSASDRAFALELFYGVLRNFTLLDFWMGCLRTAPIHFDLRDIIRLGLYQLFFLRTPEHAAVFETVQLAPKKHRALINGMLRAAARGRDELSSRANAQTLSIRTSHPQFLVERWEQNFGGRAAEALCRWNNQPPCLYARINQLKIDREKFLEAYPNSRLLSDNSNFVELDTVPSRSLNLGHCYIQDPSTAIACHLVDPQPGEKILDACAAPGGKTSYLADLMKNSGLIMACDREPDRICILKENIARLGIDIARAVRHDWTSGHLPKELASTGRFDRILIDVPCSNTGVMRRRVDVRWRLRPTDFARMQKRQLEIVRAVSVLLKPGGALVYSTCSLEPEENEEVVKQIQMELSMLRLEQNRQSLPFQDGIDGAFAAKFIRAP
jgi:16S rRNA (cytosine967-C5)-methyltransferase